MTRVAKVAGFAIAFVLILAAPAAALGFSWSGHGSATAYVNSWTDVGYNASGTVTSNVAEQLYVSGRKLSGTTWIVCGRLHSNNAPNYGTASWNGGCGGAIGGVTRADFRICHDQIGSDNCASTWSTDIVR